MELETNTNLKTELADIDSRIETLNKNIEFGNAVEALHNDPNFKLVILDGYFNEEAERIFGVLIDPNEYKRDMMQNMSDKLGSIRDLKKYFGVKLRNGDMAPAEIAEEETFRKETTEKYSITK